MARLQEVTDARYAGMHYAQGVLSIVARDGRTDRYSVPAVKYYEAMASEDLCLFITLMDGTYQRVGTFRVSE
jgi:hypothetical protein